METMYSKLKNGAIMLLCCIYLIGCSASKHLGVATIKKPEMTSKNTDAWRAYYLDQLDAYGGVVTTPDDTYPEEAQTGYKQATLDWRKQMGEATVKLYLLGAAIGLFIVMIPIIAVP